jgi:hypothetical protein
MNKETSELSDTIDEPNRHLQKIPIEYTFSAGHGTFLKIDHILGHKASLTNIRILK